MNTCEVCGGPGDTMVKDMSILKDVVGQNMQVMSSSEHYFCKDHERDSHINTTYVAVWS